MAARNLSIAIPLSRSGNLRGITGILSRMGYRFVRNWLPPMMIIAALLAFWQFASTTGLVKDFVLPPPLRVADAFIEDWSLILKHTRPTLIEAALGFIMGNTLAISLAVLFIHSSIAERGLFPVALAYRSVPFIAITPVLILAMGPGMEPKIVIASMGAFFITLVNMMRGLRSVDGEAAELMHSLSANWWQVLWKVRWPASMPFLFSSLKLAAGSCFTGAIAAEWIGSREGLGYLIVLSSYQYKIPTMWATIFMASALALTTFLLVAIVEGRMTRWARNATLPE
jgi:NitT/TauT family transport system permease protein